MDGSVHYDLGYVEPLLDCQPQPGYGFPGLHLDGIDQDGHGTLLAGTIAAVPGNTEGVSSAVQPSWNISLLPVKFFSPAAGPDAGHAAIAIAHAVIKGAKVINASWHVATGDAELWMLRVALLFAALGNRLVVISAGNDGTDNEIYPTYPANFGSLFKDHVMTVAASDRDDFKASYSNYGRNIVDIAAPGTAIVSTALYLADPPRYADYSGTSAAAAFVSSAAALVFALNPPNWDGLGAPGWQPRDVIEHLRASADVKDGLRLACRGGKRLNIARAVYGPLTLTAPTAGTTLVVNVATVITWTVAYSNPKFVNVRVEFITTANVRYHLGTVPIGARMLSWTPPAGHGRMDQDHADDRQFPRQIGPDPGRVLSTVRSTPAAPPAPGARRTSMFRRSLTAIVTIVLTVAAMMAAASADPAADEAAIRQRFQRWTADFNARDKAGVCDLFAPDLVYSIPEVVQGTRQTLCANLAAMLARSDITLHYDNPDIHDIIVMGDVAVVRLTWTLTTEVNGIKDRTTEEGMDIFRRQPDGRWSIARFVAFTTRANRLLR